MLAVIVALLLPLLLLRCLAIGLRRALPLAAGAAAANLAYSFDVGLAEALASGAAICALSAALLDQSAQTTLRPLAIAAESIAAASAAAIIAFACLSAAGVADWRLPALTILAAAGASLHAYRFRANI